MIIIVKLNISSSDLPFCQVVVYYSNNELFNVSEAEKASVTTVDSEQKFTFKLTDLDCNTKYNYCVYVKSGSNEFYTDIANFSTLQHPYLVQASTGKTSGNGGTGTGNTRERSHTLGNTHNRGLPVGRIRLG